MNSLRNYFKVRNKGQIFTEKNIFNGLKLKILMNKLKKRRKKMTLNQSFVSNQHKIEKTENFSGTIAVPKKKHNNNRLNNSKNLQVQKKER